MVRLFQKGLKSARFQRESKRGEQCEQFQGGPFSGKCSILTLPAHSASFWCVLTRPPRLLAGLKSYVAFGLRVEHMDLVSTRPGWEGGEKNGKDVETVKQLPAWVGTVPLRSPG